jgi:hypothetical protein
VDRVCLLGNELVVCGPPSSTRPFRWSALLCTLAVSATLPGALPFHLGPRHGGLDSGVHAPAVRLQIGFTVCGDEAQTSTLSGVDPVL